MQGKGSVSVPLVLLSSLACAQTPAAGAPLGEGGSPLDANAGAAGAEAPSPGAPAFEVDGAPQDLGGGDERAALTVNEPMYFVVGGRGDTRARFQLSLKYRIFADDGLVVDWVPLLKDFNFGFTQTALWNLSEESQPFEDVVYQPSFFWDLQPDWGGIFPGSARLGYEHESNGEDGEDSRSLDMLFVQPAWDWQVFGRELTLAPKVYAYIHREEQNEDIEDFRGYADVILRYGSEDGLLGQVLFQQGGDAQRQTWQLDLSYPIRRQIFARTGGYIYLQVFEGYGESLSTFDEKTGPQIRLGFGIVR